MPQQPIILLSNRQVSQRVTRIAWQIYEDNFNESSLILAGIANSGFVFAEMLQQTLTKICSIPVQLVEIRLDKENPSIYQLTPALSSNDLNDKVVIVVDDVLHSGKTLIHSLKPFLEANTKKIRTVLLVDRDHKRYPVEADFVGITLSTTLQEHVRVDLKAGQEAVYLE